MGKASSNEGYRRFSTWRESWEVVVPELICGPEGNNRSDGLVLTRCQVGAGDRNAPGRARGRPYGAAGKQPSGTGSSRPGDKSRPYACWTGRSFGQSRQMSSMDSTRWFARPRTDNRKKHM